MKPTALTLTSPRVPTKHRFTVAELESFERLGAIHEDDRIELIDGEVIEMTAQGIEHIARVDRLNRLLGRILGQRAIVRIQSGAALSDFDGPQPDVVLLRFRADYYRRSRPRIEDILLIVEVSDSTVQYDKTVKAQLYARRSVVEYWMVNLKMDELLVHRDPSPDGYRSIEILRRGQSIHLLAFPDIEIDLAEILPAEDGDA